MLKSKGADAIIVNSPVGDSGFIRRLEDLKIPVLVLQARLPDTSLDCLYTDDRGGASAAVSRLVDWGHERVACVTGIGMPYSSSNSRLQGYRDALLGSGIILSDDYVRLSDYSPRGGYECASELMGMDSPPTAIFLYSDLMALGALRALADLGKRVPRDVSVVGFDDLPLCEFSVPRLSSVSHAKADLGRKAVERIRARTSNPGLGPARTELPAMLVLRESAGNRAG
jgi:LacI family transcriptional regulator